MINSFNDCYTLENGMKIPVLGFGTYKMGATVIWKSLKVPSRLAIVILIRHRSTRQNVSWDRLSGKVESQEKSSLL